MKQTFADILSLVISNQKENYDAILPVPLHPLRKRERGYNQAELIARKLSEKTGIPLIENCLIRQKNTKRQSEMSHYSERIQNVSDAFLCTNPEYVTGKRILLLDDILTSGETMVSAAAAIKAAIEKYTKNNHVGKEGAADKSEGITGAIPGGICGKMAGIPLQTSCGCHITGIVLASSRK
jgi:ComF family protein